MLKKLFGFIPFVLTVALLAGCGGKTGIPKSSYKINETGYPISNEKITMKVLGCRSSSQSSWNDMLFFQEMEKMTNIHFEFTTPPSDTIDERKTLAFASNDLPDVFFGVRFLPTELVTYAQQNQIIPLDGYMKKYTPNLNEVLNKNEDIRKDLTASDGHIYGLTTLYASNAQYNNFFLNMQWLKNLGLNMPTTIEEYTNVLRAFKTKDPNNNGKTDEIPLSLAKSWQFNWLAGAFGILPQDNGIYVNDNNVMYAFTDERFHNYLRWLNMLYKEGLLDSASFTQESSQINAKGSDGVLGSFFGAVNVNSTVGNSLASQYDFLPPLAGPDGDRLWIKESATKSASNFVLTTKNPCPEAMMRWVDYMYSMEGAFLFTFGVENKTYKKLDNGYYEFMIPSQYSTKTEFRCKEISPADIGTPMISCDWRDYGKVMQEDLPYFETVERRKNAYDKYAKVRSPILYFSEDENREVSAIEADLNTYVQNMHARFIIGDASLENDWDNYCKTVKNIGVDRFVELYQNVVNKRN